MNENKYTRLIFDIIIFTVGTVLTKLVQFLLMPLYTTYMTTEAYGVAELTNNMSELLFPIVTLCIYEAAFRFVVGSDFSKEEIVVCISYFVFHYKYAFFLYIILYAYSFKMLIAYYIRGKGYSKLFALSGIINAVFLAVFSFLFLVVFKFNVEGYLLAIAFSYISSIIFLFFNGHLYQDLKFNTSLSIVMSEMLKYCMPLIIYNVGYWLTTMSGIYAAVIKMASVINMMQQAFYAAFQLNTSREYNSSEKELYFSNVFKLYASGILIFGSLILCISPLLAKITLKNEFYSARIYLPLILFIAIIDCLFCFFKTMYTTYKLTKKAVPSMLIGAVVNIIVCLLTVRSLGIWGICIASFLCYISQAIYRVFDIQKFVFIKCDWKVIVPCILVLFLQVLCLTREITAGTIMACLLAVTVIVVNIKIYHNELLLIVCKVRRKFDKK